MLYWSQFRYVLDLSQEDRHSHFGVGPRFQHSRELTTVERDSLLDGMEQMGHRQSSALDGFRPPEKHDRYRSTRAIDYRDGAQDPYPWRGLVTPWAQGVNRVCPTLLA